RDPRNMGTSTAEEAQGTVRWGGWVIPVSRREFVVGDKFRALLSMCKDEGIEISYQPLDQKNGLLGLYFRAQDGTPIIILDKHLERNPRVERCVLAEEVFHHFTGVTYSIFNPHRCYGTAVLSQKHEHV